MTTLFAPVMINHTLVYCILQIYSQPYFWGTASFTIIIYVTTVRDGVHAVLSQVLLSVSLDSSEISSQCRSAFEFCPGVVLTSDHNIHRYALDVREIGCVSFLPSSLMLWLKGDCYSGGYVPCKYPFLLALIVSNYDFFHGMSRDTSHQFQRDELKIMAEHQGGRRSKASTNLLGFKNMLRRSFIEIQSP